jgi:hypothetical protein
MYFIVDSACLLSPQTFQFELCDPLNVDVSPDGDLNGRLPHNADRLARGRDSTTVGKSFL